MQGDSRPVKAARLMEGLRLKEGTAPGVLRRHPHRLRCSASSTPGRPRRRRVRNHQLPRAMRQRHAGQ